MVRIHARIVRKKYRNKIYSYTQHLILLPLASNKDLTSFLGQQLDLNIKDDALVLALKKSMEKKLDGERN